MGAYTLSNDAGYIMTIHADTLERFIAESVDADASTKYVAEKLAELFSITLPEKPKVTGQAIFLTMANHREYKEHIQKALPHTPTVVWVGYYLIITDEKPVICAARDFYDDWVGFDNTHNVLTPVTRTW